MDKQTWYLKEEVVTYRVAGSSFLNNNICQKVIVVNGNGSMVIDYQCWSCVWYLLYSMNLIAWKRVQYSIPLEFCSHTFDRKKFEYLWSDSINSNTFSNSPLCKSEMLQHVKYSALLIHSLYFWSAKIVSKNLWQLLEYTSLIQCCATLKNLINETIISSRLPVEISPHIPNDWRLWCITMPYGSMTIPQSSKGLPSAIP